MCLISTARNELEFMRTLLFDDVRMRAARDSVLFVKAPTCALNAVAALAEKLRSLSHPHK